MTQHSLLIALSVLIACGSDDNDTAADSHADHTMSDPTDSIDPTDSTAPTGGPDTDDETAMLRAFHVGVNVPGVDIFVNDDPGAIVENLTYETAAGYLEVPATTYDVDIAVSPGTPEDSVLAVDGLALASDSMSTVVAYGELGTVIQAAVLNDDPAGLDDDTIRVNVLHGAYDVGEVDIWNITDMNAPSPLLENVGLGVSASLDLPVSTYTLGFDLDNDGVPELSFTVPELPGGAVYDVVAVSEGIPNVHLAALLPDNTVVSIPAN